MANKPTVIHLTNGDVATLRYDFAALTALEEQAGINVFEKSAFKNLSPVRIRDLVWAGLLHKQPELTRAEAAKLIPLDDITGLSTAVVEAMTAAMPKK